MLINEIDYKRFLKLSDLIKKNAEITSEKSPGTRGEMSIYTSKSDDEIEFVSLSISGYVPKKFVADVLK